MDVFLRDLEKLDENVRHSLDEYEKAFGSGYIDGLIRRYGLTMRGRTLKTYAKRLRKTSLKIILDANPGGCSELGTVSHFHVDLFGNYIPGLCTGLAISVDELGEKLDDQEYRFLNALYNSGISKLLEIAKKDFGFIPKDEYLSKCDLCLDIRTWLVKDRNIRSKDLQPVEYYDRLN